MDRRDFLKSALVAGIALPGDFGQGQFRRRDVRRTVDPSQIPAYAFRTIPVGRFPDLRREFEVMRREGGLSPNKTFLNDIAPLDISLPADFPGAKSVVVIAAFSKTMVANFKLDGRTHGVFVPPQYYRDGLNAQTLPAVVRNDILKARGSRTSPNASR